MSGFRARKAGIAYQQQKKCEQRYDDEEALGTPQRIMDWINSSMNGEHPACAKSSWRHMQFWMRDGILLCKFINKLRASAGMSPVKFKPNALTAFIAMENIESFNKAAVEYGMGKEACFNSTDLYEGQKATFLNVINCLNVLGCTANKKGYSPCYEEPPAPSAT